MVFRPILSEMGYTCTFCLISLTKGFVFAENRLSNTKNIKVIF